MLIQAIDYEAVDRGEADFEHYFCSYECADAAGFNEDDCEEIGLEELFGEDSYFCEMCGELCKVKEK